MSPELEDAIEAFKADPTFETATNLFQLLSIFIGGLPRPPMPPISVDDDANGL